MFINQIAQAILFNAVKNRIEEDGIIPNGEYEFEDYIEPQQEIVETPASRQWDDWQV